MWYAKMYFSGKKEVFQFDSHGIKGVPSTYKELPFLESLLSFLELDCGELAPALRRVAEHRSHLIREDDREAGTAAMAELGQLKSRHIYLELLYVRCYDRVSRMGANIPVSEQENQQILEELRELPEQLPLYQRQVQRLSLIHISTWPLCAGSLRRRGRWPGSWSHRDGISCMSKSSSGFW